MTKCQFLHDNNNADAKATAIPRVFSENSQAENTEGVQNKRTMMVLYRSPEYHVVKVYNSYKFQISQFKAI